MKKFALTLMAIAISSIVMAQDGIQFSHGTWKEILAKAKQENKDVLLDCYTSWCGPCKKMSAEVFTLKEVGDFFNSDFVSLKMDMEKGEGIELQKKFEIAAFPTMIIFNSKGEELHRFVGFKSGKELILEAKKIDEGKTYSYYSKEYNKGNRQAEFVLEFMDLLKKMRKKDELASVTEEYLISIGSKKWEDADNWEMIHNQLSDNSGYSPIIKYVQLHKSKYIDLYGKSIVNNRLTRIFLVTARGFMTEEQGKKVTDLDAFSEYISSLEEMGVENVQFIKMDAEIYYEFERRDWDEYINKVEISIESMGDDIIFNQMYYYANLVAIHCKDEAVRKEALKWCQITKEAGINEHLSKLLKAIEDKLIAH